LRIALSVARFKAGICRHQDAKALLAMVYDRSTDGFATADFQAARITLEGLPT